MGSLFEFSRVFVLSLLVPTTDANTLSHPPAKSSVERQKAAVGSPRREMAEKGAVKNPGSDQDKPCRNQPGTGCFRGEEKAKFLSFIVAF